jgi:membrane protein
MPSLKQRVTATVDRLRERFGWLDHTLKMLSHYGSVNGNAQAGAVTYFGFLSIFPILAIAFFVVGKIADLYPDIRAQMVSELANLLPGIIGATQGGIPMKTIEDAASKVGFIGLLALVYAGLGWLSATRQALEVMFAVPRREFPNMLFGKLRDLGALVLVGVVLMVSVALSGAVTGFSGMILGWIDVDPDSLLPTVLLSLIGHVLAIAASMVLLMTMFRLLLVETHAPRRALLGGALLGAVGFELLKLLANELLGLTRGQAAFQVFGVALILLIWINYFSRLVMYSAAWAYTSPGALEQRTTEAMRAPGAALTSDPPPTPPAEAREVAVPDPVEARVVAVSGRTRPWLIAVAGAVVGWLAAVVVRAARR